MGKKGKMTLKTEDQDLSRSNFAQAKEKA